MGKKLIIVVLALGLFMTFLAIKAIPGDRKVLGTKSDAQDIKKEPQNIVEFEVNGKKTKAIWQFVEDTSRLSLIPNFNEEISALDMFEKKACKLLVSAGFYTEDQKPTGLFIYDGVSLRKFSTNSLLNGVLSINYIGTPRITTVVPNDPLRIALQTGPILKENASFKKLSLVRDEPARRVVAAVTGENKLFYIIFYDPESLYMGPLLEEMPDILKIFEEKTKIEIADAVNLDGGSASAFYTNNLKLSELTLVGSFFCER